MYDRYVVKLDDGTIGYCEFAKVGMNVVVLVRDGQGHYRQKRGKVKEIIEDKQY